MPKKKNSRKSDESLTAKTIELSEEQLAAIENLSALGKSNEEIAMYLNVDAALFNGYALDENSDIHYHLQRGILVTALNEEMAFLKAAQDGDDKAEKTLSEIRYRRDFRAASRQFLYTAEFGDYNINLLQDYIETGNDAMLKPGERLYLEMMVIMMSMQRKYGRQKTMAVFQKPPFNMPYAKVRDMYEQAINLFYIDSKVEKKAMRNLKAQQLEDAAEMVRRTATTPKDFETYAKLIKLSAEIRQLNQPEKDDIPKGTFDKPIRVYTLDPERVGIAPVNRQILAAQIDSIKGATEAEKQRVRAEAGVEDIIPLEDLINDTTQNQQ